MEIDTNVLTILISVACGAMLGMEREYQNKSAGLRTMVLICLGSTVFTIISRNIGSGTDDRIAANIITGIGFIGAGVIFKENFNVKGLTTAAVIWISAAIGMMIGSEEYRLGIILTVIVLVVLLLFSKIEALVDYINHQRTYRITFIDDNLENIDEVMDLTRKQHLKPIIRHLTKTNNKLIAHLEVRGSEKYFLPLAENLIRMPVILEMEH